MRRFLYANEVAIDYSSWQLIKDIVTLVKPYRWRFFIASLLRLLSDLSNLYPAYAVGKIVTLLASNNRQDNLHTVWTIVILWLIALSVRHLTMFFAKYLCFGVSEKISIDAQLQTIHHMFLLDMSWHEKENSGNKLKRIQNAGSALDKILRLWINSIIEIGVNFIGMIFIIYTFDPLVSLLLLAFMISFFSISKVLTKRGAIAAYEVNVQEEEVTGLLFEALSNIRTVKIMSIMRGLYDNVAIEAEKLFAKIKRRITRTLGRNHFLFWWGSMFQAGIIAFIIYGITQGRYEVGFIVLFNGYFRNIWESISELSDAGQEFAVSKYSISRMKDVLKEPVTIDDEQGKVLLPKDWQSISVKDVTFSYGDNKVLDHVSFDIKRGEKIGVVGLSGAGKSTLFKLLLKEHEDYTGEISFDGLPLREISKHDYFKSVAVVLQETEVFNFSLRDNVTLGNIKDATDEKHFKKTLSISHITDFLKKLPDGVETFIGEKGVKLSGGEKQRLGIARAVFKKPELLLLDEATSHLDLESEEKIQDSLHQFFQDVTAIVIAHRLTTIKEMDKILVIEEGKIIESGNFDELYKKQGRFYELWEKQRL